MRVKPILKHDLKSIKHKFKEIKSAYNKRFSLKRYYSLKLLNVFAIILKTIGMFLVPLFLYLLLAYISFILFSNRNITNLLNLSSILIGISSASMLSVFVAILISFGTSNEYFNCTERKIFFSIRFWLILDNSYLGLQSLIYVVFSLISIFQEDYILSITMSLLGIIFSAILLVRFLIYSRKDKYERFDYYLEHSLYRYRTNPYNLIKDYILVLNIFILQKKEINTSLLLGIASDRMKFLLIFINEIKIMIENNECIIKEQNIVEKYLLKRAKNIITPIEEHSLFFASLLYVNMLLKVDNLNLIKDVKATIKTLFDCYCVSLNSFQKNNRDLAIKIDDLPDSVIFYLDFFKVIPDQFHKLTYPYMLFSVSASGFLNIFVDISKKWTVDVSEYIKFIKNENERIEILSKDMSHSEDVLLKRIKSNLNDAIVQKDINKLKNNS